MNTQKRSDQINARWLGALGLVTCATPLMAQLAFTPPEGGWDYIYQGDEATYVAPGEGIGSLDGTWSHDNGSDEWDGSGIGGELGDGNRPGGAMIITEGETSYLRIQDTGDPRDYGYGDPGSNRKVYLGHDLSADGASATLMDDGVTLIIRARIPTSGPLDELHRDGQGAAGPQPYPEDGDGYVTSDGGKGNFVIKQEAGGAIAFSLATATDTPGGDPNSLVTGFTGLSFNEFNGNQISGDVNFGQGEGSNVIALDPTEWHEYWITIEKDEANVGTHVARIYVDGSAAPQTFKITAGTGSDFGGSYLAIGSTATPQNSALDIDFYGVKFEAVEPAAKTFGPIEGGWDYAYEGDQADYAAPGEGLGSLDGTWSHDNGSDEWDGSGIGGEFGDGNRPGGAMIIEEAGINYLRIQDTGDPRDYGYGDPGSNRKVYLGHDLSADGASSTVLDDGVTLNFRARIPTTGPIDPLHRDGQGAAGPQPYPDGGDGYVTSDGGKGNFVIKQEAGGAIAFSLATATDTPGGDPNSLVTGFDGLSFNEFNGNAISGDVNFGQGEGSNVIAFDPTQWHDIWITIEQDEANVGTHVANIYVDGSLTPQVFKITAGTGSDFGGSYLAMGSTATPQNSALDIDYYRVKFGVVPPTGAISEKLDIVGLSPDAGAVNVNPADGISFQASASEGSIPRENISLVLNGIDYTSELIIEGNETSWNVSFNNLQANSVYKGEVAVRGAGGSTITGLISFDTINPDGPGFEAENWNFDRGEFINDPDHSFNGNTYFTKGETQDTEGIDFHELSEEFDINNAEPWRLPINNMPNTVSNNNEANRLKFQGEDDADHTVNNTEPGEWLNYTRNFDLGESNLLLRAGGSIAFEVQLDRVTSNASQPDQTTEKIGSFKSGGIRTGFDWVPLTDDSGRRVVVDLSGEITLRATIVSGSPSMNFFLATDPVVEVEPPVEEDGEIASITLADGEVVIEFSGTLMSADSVSGPYNEVQGASSPYTVSPDQAAQFFIAR